MSWVVSWLMDCAALLQSASNVSAGKLLIKPALSHLLHIFHRIGETVDY